MGIREERESTSHSESILTLFAAVGKCKMVVFL